MLIINNVSKWYNNKQILYDLSLQVEVGEVFGFLGPNGSGKTTLIRALLQLVKVEQGEFWIAGNNVKQNYSSALNETGAIIETPVFYEYMSGLNNLRLAARIYPEVQESDITEVLGIVGLQESAQDKVKTYSLGMKQRLGLARALLHKPKLVILDEPSNGLDPQGIRDMRTLIRQLAAEKEISFFISSHLLHEVEQMCDRVAIINKGKLLACGQVSALLSEQKNKNLEDYFIQLTQEVTNK